MYVVIFAGGRFCISQVIVGQFICKSYFELAVF